MPDVPVVAVIIALPGSETIVRDALTAVVEPTRAEAGCRSYELYESATEPGTFVTMELWREAADLDKHMATPHIAAVLAAADGHLAGPPAIHSLNPIG